MRIERVIAHAFGPFSGDSLELAPGLTVVSGPNEAGKSSWHAAIRAGICGVRRGRGAGTKVETMFEERHRPWDGDGRWAVEVRLALDDGRRIEVSQDLAGKVACRATDIVLGRDVSDEIMDGTPDASRWLGLDRDAFAATICVGQAEIAAIAGRETAASLQEHMQRAAATRGTDATAAEARERLDAFRRQHIGVDRQGARGPLRAAKERAESARVSLADARERHEEFIDASLNAEAAERAAGAQAQRVATIEAGLAGRAAAELARRAARAAVIAERHPSEPAGMADRDALADAVAGALDAWLARPRVEPLTGTSAEELEAELSGLPAPPDGDLEVDAAVAHARRALDRTEDAVGLLGSRPTAPQAHGGPAEDDLRALARRLRTPDPDPQPGLEAEVLAAEQDAASPPARGAWAVAAAVAAVLAVATFAIGQPLVAAAIALSAVGLGAWAWLGRRAYAGQDRLEHARAALAPVALARASARAERDAAAEAARALGLPADADEIDRRADAIAAGIRAAREAAAWDTHRADLDGGRARAEATLRDALAARGADIETDPRAAMAAYEAACRRRAEQARRAGARAALERALETRRAAEAAALETSRSTDRAEHALRGVAAEIGLEPERPAGELAEALAAWRREQGAQAQRADAARGEWHELTTLLDGRTLDQLRAEAEAAAARAATLAARVDRAQLAELASRDDLPSLLEVERDELRRVSAEASSQRGALAEIQRDLPDVTEAEEALAEASAELERVIGLQEVLERTAGLLRAAEERVHRDLAPVLSREITRWLPRVTMGAYTEATVDPADLSIRVKHAATGQWRPPPAQHRSQPSVELLSEGTGEQIYLLLRVAMAQYLVTTGETAPLLLDEVTVQADAQRKQQLLGVLHELSAERQIILFTHDDDVVDWAASTLSAPRDRLVELRAGAPHAAVG